MDTMQKKWQEAHQAFSEIIETALKDESPQQVIRIKSEHPTLKAIEKRLTDYEATRTNIFTVVPLE